MPLTKVDVVRLIKAAVVDDEEEKIQLLMLAGQKPSLWFGLDEEDVVACLRTYLRTQGKRANVPRSA